MSDHIPAHISIGGKPTFNEVAVLYNTVGDFIDEFYQAADDDGCGPTWGEYYIDNKDRFVKDLKSLKKGNTLELYADQASYGELQELEAFCQRYGLTYVKYAEADMEYSADIHQWKPGIDKNDEVILTTQEENPVILTESIQKALDTAKSDKEAVNAVRKLLKENKPIDVPPLDLSEVWKVYKEE